MNFQKNTTFALFLILVLLSCKIQTNKFPKKSEENKINFNTDISQYSVDTIILKTNEIQVINKNLFNELDNVLKDIKLIDSVNLYFYPIIKIVIDCSNQKWKMDVSATNDHGFLDSTYLMKKSYHRWIYGCFRYKDINFIVHIPQNCDTNRKKEILNSLFIDKQQEFALKSLKYYT
ncbi:MAG: hypothetical protein KA275_01745, partial [Chitinophagaceae bacterium]|nr:hypothetical protein [Chitinophagaceae bacterium]